MEPPLNLNFRAAEELPKMEGLEVHFGKELICIGMRISAYIHRETFPNFFFFF